MKRHASTAREAVLYARVSSEEQEKEGYSIPAQMKFLHGYAGQEGIRILYEFIDVETAKQPGRPGFMAMVDCFAKKGVVLSPSSHSSEKFMHGIKVLMAKNYVDNLGEEVKKGMRERGTRKPRKVKHQFAFANLIRCGHCGCSLVGEIKKGRYVYYHCTYYKGKCPEPYVREEVLEKKFTEILRALHFDQEVLDWVTEALQDSHVEEKQFHDEAIDRLQKAYKRFQDRIDRMYIDKLDGRIDAGFFDQKSAEWRAEQTEILNSIQKHQAADQSYLEEGVAIIELASRAADLFEKQPAREKRRLLDFVLSNSTWANGELTPEFRQPFDMIALEATACASEKVAGVASDDLLQNRLPDKDSNLGQSG